MTYRFLIAEDDETTRSLVKSYIEAYAKISGRFNDFSVDFAQDGQEAINAIINRQGHFSLILLDVKMPAMSGIDVYHFMLQNFPVLVTKTLWITGYSLDLEDFLLAKNLPHLTKPFDLSSFSFMLDKLLFRDS